MSRTERWEPRAEVTLLLQAPAFLVAHAWPVLDQRVDVALIAPALPGALALLDAEQDATDANTTGIGDALWWSTTTDTTVGYGDRFPVTTEGRLIAIGLMLVGIAMVGVITASVAAWMVAQVRTEIHH